MSKKIKYGKSSFTLAEVLITLVIIGIIAAITVPVMMANHRKTETAARLKKFYSTLSNAIRLAEIDNGTTLSEWGNTAFDYVVNYLNITEKDEDNDKYILTDGTTLTIGKASMGGLWTEGAPGPGPETAYATMLTFDTNGDKKPNEIGRDRFIFYFVTGGQRTTASSYSRTQSGLVTNPWAYGENTTRSSLIERCIETKQLVESSDFQYALGFCTELVMRDGWEFKDDYPLKI